MMGTQPSQRQPALFSYATDLERRVSPDHLLRRVAAALDLSFVVPAVSQCYGRCGNVSLDPRTVMKILLLLFLYDIPSERELMEQIGVRLDFLWFLGFDLDTDIPDHSVLSKARARWGGAVFEQLFIKVVGQCVAAGLVGGRLLHVDSTIVKANAHKDSVVSSGPELVKALRQAYQVQEAKLQAVPGPAAETPSAQVRPEPSGAPAAEVPASSAPRSCPNPQSELASEQSQIDEPTKGQSSLDNAPGITNVQAAPVPKLETAPCSAPVSENLAQQPKLQICRRVSPAAERTAQVGPQSGAAAPDSGRQKAAAHPKLPVNSTHISTTDPLAELARNKSGVTELNYKDHRLVDDAYAVITAVADTTSNVGDGSMLPELHQQHLANTQLKVPEVTLAGDGHYGTASNYLYCEHNGVRAHLAEVTAHLEERGQLPLSQFTYEPQHDRLRCPQGHYLVLHQERLEIASKVYLIEDPAHCAGCPLVKQCTPSKRGRSIKRHLQADLIEAARREAHSPAARYSRRRRRHVMEGSFADANNNHGAKKARWRGLARQQIQSWIIAAVQNLRILLRNQRRAPAADAAKLVELLALKVSGHLQVARSLAFGEHNLRWSSLARRWRAPGSGKSPRTYVRYGSY
jgi:transposase